MFLIKKLVGAFLLPLPFSSLLLLVGLLFLWFTKRQRLGKVVTSIGVLILFVFSSSTVSNLLLRPLERSYPPVLASPEQIGLPGQPTIKWIVVLGAGDNYTPALPFTTQLGDASLARIVEAIRLHRELPDSKLVVSEGTTYENMSVAEVMARAAQTLGVAEQDIVLEKQARDTEGSARFVQSIVGTDRFILVTSASHMKRAQALFRKLGMDPIAAPTDYESLNNLIPGVTDFLPNSSGARKADLALHEYIGLVWARLRGKI
jgi:uncharacterized SAM-binding protein YcdF (DUF218 family)